MILLLVGFAVWGSFSGKKDKDSANALPTKTSQTFDLEKNPVVGKKDAPVTMMIFEDFQCPHCAAWNEEIYPQVKEKLLDTGKAKLYFLDYHITQFGDRSYYASMASEYVWRKNPTKWYDFSHELYKNQTVLTNEFLADKVTKYVDGISKENVKKNLEKDHMYIDGILADNQKGDTLGVTGTPSLFVNGKMVNEPGDVDALVKKVNSLIKGGK